jgi:aminopeptidase N
MTEKAMQAIYRKDYQPVDYQVSAIDLKIVLGEAETSVTSTLNVCYNSGSSSNTLTLLGDGQALASVKIDGVLQTQDQYCLTAETLTFSGLQETSVIEITTRIKPQENKSLMGLYQSGGVFCTQCEPEGFRKITYYPDRPDVLSVFTTTIVADKKTYPVLLSNGNLIEADDLDHGQHFARWHDPFKKPAYLFAMVAGDLGFIEDEFITMSGRKVVLRIYAAHDRLAQCHFAMSALKKSMRWDETVYGREYDLDIFMILTVNDFNFGAMENKGLNIFNDRYILASPQTATDRDYANIDAVVAHEYFHNWSGNRVTVRDWFQLSLKEGLTVFRDHGFSQDIGLQEVVRIQEVNALRSVQFIEDAGPLAHPIRPDAYIEMNNFYTPTVYEKGAEVIRMMKILLGDENFRKGTDLYFDRFDGQAVTCEDFVDSMQAASGLDLGQFKLWYSQAGTPKITVTSEYNATEKTYTLHMKQQIPATPGQPEKQAMLMPISVALFDEQGHQIHKEQVLHLSKPEEHFVFHAVETPVVPSLLRGFSAPVTLLFDYSDDELAMLMACDTDGFARWEAGQQYAYRVLLALVAAYQEKTPLVVPDNYINAMRQLLFDKKINKALIAEMLKLPTQTAIAQRMDVIDVAAIYHARNHLKADIVKQLGDVLKTVYFENSDAAPYEYTIEAVAKRSLKNVCLSYLSTCSGEVGIVLTAQQFEQADNMTDQISALANLASAPKDVRNKGINAFYEQWQSDPLVMDKWFAVQAGAEVDDVLQHVKTLLSHPLFVFENPNKAYALLGTFASGNPFYFHCAAGYEFITDQVLKLDKINPRTATRIMKPLTQWKKYDEKRKALMHQQLTRIAAQKKLSKDVYELVTKALSA